MIVNLILAITSIHPAALNFQSAIGQIPQNDSPSWISQSPVWTTDVSIWDMSQPSTWTGYGLTYCSAVYSPDGTQYATAIVDSAGSQGPTAKIFRSMDGGETWDRRNRITGGSWYISDPEIALSPGNPPDYLFLVFASTSAADARPIGFRYTLPLISFDAQLEPDWPDTDSLLGVELVCNPSSQQLWLFGCDGNDDIYLSRSDDLGDSWATAELVASGAAAPSAAAGDSEWVHLAYRRLSDDRIMSVSFGDTSYYEVEVGQGASLAAPVIASETVSGTPRVAIVYHDTMNDARMAVSSDNGASWEAPVILSSGIYPFIDVNAQNGRCAVAFVEEVSDRVYCASASDLALIPSAAFQAVTDQPVATGCPPLARHGYQPDEVALFYMNPGTGAPHVPQNLWYDNSLFTQSNPGSTRAAAPLTVWPNPFVSGFSVDFSMDRVSPVSLMIYSLDGRLLESIYSGETRGGSFYAGQELPAGVYYLVLDEGGMISSRRIVKI
jgi:hypothetical protein